MGIMEKKLETTIMGYIGLKTRAPAMGLGSRIKGLGYFRVWGLGF